MDGKLQCELCHSKELKKNIHICESGHIICLNCNDISYVHLNSQFSNYTSEKDNHTEENISRNNLAGGDYKPLKKKKVKIQTCQDLENSKSHHPRNELEYMLTLSPGTTFVYKNENYDDNESIDNCVNKNYLVNYVTQKKYIRPIVCPVLNCKKTVILDCILKHFAFDHAKIPALTLEINKPLKISLKHSELSLSSQCIAIFNPVQLNSPLLLMAAEIKSACGKNITENFISSNKSMSQIRSDNKIRKDKNNSSHCHISTQPDSEKDIVLWVCRLNNAKHLYSITVTRDHNLSYSYVGEGLHIQNSQDPVNVCTSPECLIIRHQSMAKLQDRKLHLHVYINVIK